MRRIYAIALGLLLAAACTREPALVRLEAARPNARAPDAALLLRVLPAPGARINARLKPALELPDGTVLRFDSPHLTPDSAYFTAAPTAAAPESNNARHGLLRASVCPAGASVCRTVELAVRF